MNNKLSDERLEEIRAKYAHYPESKRLDRNTAVAHIRTLLREIDRLRSQ